MSAIELITKLREMTGAGIKDCNNALKEANNNIEAAVKILREKGIASAVKRADRSAKQGVVVAKLSDDKKQGVLVELNCETDFVARTEKFKVLAESLADFVAKTSSTENIAEQKFDDTRTVQDVIKEAIGTIGENIVLKRTAKFSTTGEIASYIHMNNSLGVLVNFEAPADVIASEDFKNLEKEIAMQVAAVSPLYVTRDQVPQEEIDKEKEIYVKQLQEEGKPANIIDKIVLGKLNKFYSQICLMEQPYMREEKENIKNVIAKVNKDIVVKQFARFKIGE
ncbi:MAG: elongation factor Ts [Elusimicrobia bacterium]|nr:elongation factor Ts [Elusimicrobiota bacterium]